MGNCVQIILAQGLILPIPLNLRFKLEQIWCLWRSGVATSFALLKSIRRVCVSWYLVCRSENAPQTLDFEGTIFKAPKKHSQCTALVTAPTLDANAKI
jgi:hypothetical protein